MRSKILVTCLVVSLVVAMSIPTTSAYFTDSASVNTKSYAMGSIAMDLSESDNQDADLILPGVNVTKDPTVSLQIDSESAWVFLEVSIGDKFKDMMDQHQATSGLDLRNQFESWVEFNNGSEASPGINPNWEFIKSESNKLMYGLSDVLNGGQSSALFTSILVSEDLTQEEVSSLAGSNFDIDISATAIQVMPDILTVEEAYARLA